MFASRFIRQTPERRAPSREKLARARWPNGFERALKKRMPKKYGVKEKDQVVSHILNLVLTGKLRSGDRVDRNEIALGLGVSRVPIQEALVQLEHDGIVSTRYHRGAFVERFDEATVLEHHELDGLLNGIASARAATNPTPRILGQLDTLMRSLRSAKDARAFSRNRRGISAHRQRRVRRTAAARHDSRFAKPHPPGVLDDLPGAAATKCCRSTKTRPPRYTAATPTPRGPRASAAPT